MDIGPEIRTAAGVVRGGQESLVAVFPGIPYRVPVGFTEIGRIFRNSLDGNELRYRHVFGENYLNRARIGYENATVRISTGSGRNRCCWQWISDAAAPVMVAIPGASQVGVAPLPADSGDLP